MATAPAAPADVFAPLRVPNASALIVRRIGEAIESGVLAPAQRLPSERELAARLAVAPMTLRQAIAILRDAGLVETRRGKHGGTFVIADVVEALAATSRLPGATALRDLADWRRAVSSQVAALAATRASPADVERIAGLADAVEELTADAFPAFRLADSRFHLAIAAAAGSARLLAAETAIQAELGEVLAAIPAPVRARRASTAGHEPIVAGIRAADEAAAGEAMTRHVEATHDWIVGLSPGRPERARR